MTNNKVYSIIITVSEYNETDEGFYTVKENKEVVHGAEHVLETIESVYSNVVKYIEKRLT